MSAGLLPVSLGMALTMLVTALCRRIRASIFALTPTGEWGTDLRPSDFATGNVIAGAVMVISLSGAAWCAWKLYRMRSEVESTGESFSIEEHVESPVTRRSGSEDDR
ncbi:MAG TPA: hypothetical protein VGK73_08875 [Polyangiaceae bacterium]